MTWKTFWSPALRIAGGRALLWGLAGLIFSTVCAALTRWHAHGLLHFGPAPNNAWWVFAAEYLIIWLVPAAIFYSLGSALSRSRVRPVDILGTTAFALLPLAAMNLWQLIPGVRNLLDAFTDLATPAAAADHTALLQNMMEIMARPLFILNMLVALATMVLLVVWLFYAVRICCNLGGGRLWVVYLVGVIGGDALCRFLIAMMY
jgi:hypothetical protein